ncbi:MAG: hypothetical protein R6V75_09645 [Bacteroidales bacterium]
MKTMRMSFKIAGAVVLLYAQLMVLTAIDIKKTGSEPVPEVPAGLSLPIPVDDPEPECLIEPWMLDESYLDHEDPEPEARIESWMLDAGYLGR